MNPENTAIVLVDDDNDFLTEGGKLHGAVKQVLESNNVVSNINDLMNRAREKGLLIIHVPSGKVTSRLIKTPAPWHVTC